MFEIIVWTSDLIDFNIQISSFFPSIYLFIYVYTVQN